MYVTCATASDFTPHEKNKTSAYCGLAENLFKIKLNLSFARNRQIVAEECDVTTSAMSSDSLRIRTIRQVTEWQFNS